MKKAGTRRRRPTQAGSSEIGDGVIDNLINDLKENAFRRADATPVWRVLASPLCDHIAEAARAGHYGDDTEPKRLSERPPLAQVALLRMRCRESIRASAAATRARRRSPASPGTCSRCAE